VDEFITNAFMKQCCIRLALEFDMQEGSFIGSLTTIGRKTGKEHTVPLRLVFYNGSFYASRTNPGGDWLQNITKNPHVTIEVDGRKVTGKASIVDDEAVSSKISSLKYGDERSSIKRIIVEITPT
jgi:deazaflavin-dependent oxidoreductase (nitroreductase family)